MSISVQETIHAPKSVVWDICTDVEGAVDRISGIHSVKVLERPTEGLVGLKWEETRSMFGKEATETMWISSAEVGTWYETTAHSCGCIYTTRLNLEEADGGTVLAMSFSSTPTTLAAKAMAWTGVLFKKMLRTMLQQDMRDIRLAAESMGAEGPE